MSTTLNRTTRVHCAHIACRNVPVSVEIARFRGDSGVEELHLMARPTAGGSFEEQLRWLSDGSREALAELGAADAGTVLRRYFCSDLVNQALALAAQVGDEPCAVSCVGQPPAEPAEVALWSYCLRDPRGPLDRLHADNTLTLRRGTLQHHWTCGIAHPGPPSAYTQTQRVLVDYESFLRGQNLTLADHVVRTWLFLRDIDADYADLVQARREFFAERGLTSATHYITSTGIAGAGADPATRVTLDAYAIAGVQPGQIAFLRAPEQLCPTDLYGVTFERGTSIAYRDRRHVLISGTASIDDQGRLLHPGDVRHQLDRTLDNIEALLNVAGAGGDDLCHLIAYVRHAGDATAVHRGLRERFAAVPLIVVTAPVCRPGWLVEVEGQAIVPATNPTLPPF
ncbi:MAG: Rid family hydrolase [Phycisphaerae bacterium]|jgi:enamine deaminase RidA (YjgF/YER057c/UK114 family)